MSRPAYRYAHEQARRDLLASDPLCVHCPPGEANVATIADHQPPLSLHDHVDGSGCCVLVPSCRDCSYRQAGELGRAAQRLLAAPIEVEAEADASDPDDPRWAVRWLCDLFPLPAQAQFPRYATVPHPDAVGSYGFDVERSAALRGVELRWWQRFVIRLLLQHDEAGELLMRRAVISTRRQAGKSWLFRELGYWRLHQGPIWGRQEVITTARHLKAARAIPGPIVMDFVGDDLYGTKRANDRMELIAPDGSVWFAMSQSAVYGESAGLVMVDECWDVKASTIDEGVEPVMIERDQAQLILTSTAHRKCTALMPGRRQQAIERLESPERATLIVEWSAPRDADIEDRAVWRRSSPHWTRRIEDEVAEAFERAVEGIGVGVGEPDPIEGFRSQWLNVWPARAVATSSGEPLLDVATWRMRSTSMADHVFVDAVIAIEDWHGLGVGAVGAGMTPDGVIVVSASTFDDRRDAFAWLSSKTVAGVSAVCCGVTLSQDPALSRLTTPIVRCGVIETRSALGTLRQMVRDGRLLNVPDDDFDEQVHQLHVRSSTSQHLVICSRERSDLVRCAGWAAMQLQKQQMFDPAIS